MKNNSINQSYYPLFDYLRAGCAITVMLYHAKVLTWSQSGDLAVQVFFALSGWLIGGILIHTRPNELYRFYFNRAIRIWIPYYIALALILILSVFRDPLGEKWLEIVIYKLTFVYNLFGPPQLATFAEQMPLKATFNHAWSVNAEEQFYLLAPILIVLVGRHLGKNPITWAALSAGGLIFNIYPAILLGVLSATLAATQRTKVYLNSSATKKWIIFLLLLVAFTLGNEEIYHLTAPLFSILLVLILAIPGKQNQFEKIIGGMSYPLYLNHWIGVYAINFALPSIRNTISSAILSSLISILLAIAMYAFIDRKLLENRNQWYAPSKGIIITLTAYAIPIAGIAYAYLQHKFT